MTRTAEAVRGRRSLAALRPFVALFCLSAVCLVSTSCATGYSAWDTQYYSGPPSPGTCYWQVPAYSNHPVIGPGQAEGVVFFLHGWRQNRKPGWTRLPPPAIARFAHSGWDVVKVQRNERCEGRWSRAGAHHIADLNARITAARLTGYRRVILAGQSTGAAIVLGASRHSPHLHGVIAFAISHGRRRCRGTFHPDDIKIQQRWITQAIRASRTPRLILLLAEGDHCKGYSFTPAINAALGQNKKHAFIYLDETSAIPGHGAAKTTRFDKRYGACIHEFMTREPLASGPGACP